MKKRKGMSLIEVILSLALVGLLTVMVGSVVSSSHITAATLQKIPALYYTGEYEVEKTLSELNEQLKQKYNIENTLRTLSESDPAYEGLRAKQQQMQASIEDVAAREEITLFGKSVDVYRFTYNFVTNGGFGSVMLTAGAAGGVRLERLAPIIESVEIKTNGEVLPQADSSRIDYIHTAMVSDSSYTYLLQTTVNYSATNAQYQLTPPVAYYQWYVSKEGFRGAYYSDNSAGGNEPLIGTLMPAFPADFDMIGTSASGLTTLDINDEAYKNKFICCTVTPLSINGKMGTTVRSNLVYVSDIPKNAPYIYYLDASLLSLPEAPFWGVPNVDIGRYKIEKNTVLGSLSPNVENSSGNCLFPNLVKPQYYFKTSESGGQDKRLQLVQTGATLTKAGTPGSRTRYLHFSKNTELIEANDGTYFSNKAVFIALAYEGSWNEGGENTPGSGTDPKGNFLHLKKNNGNGNGNAINLGFKDNDSNLSRKYQSGWRLLVMRCNDSQYMVNVTIGAQPIEFELAELVILNNPNDDKITAVLDAIESKYHLTEERVTDP